MLRLLGEKVVCSTCVACRGLSIRTCVYSQELENKYSDLEKGRILQIINEADTDTLSRYNITKIKLKKIVDWRTKNGKVKTLTDIETIDGFTEKYTRKLCDNILEGPQNIEPILTKKIKGQVLHPAMLEPVRKHCKTVLAVYVTANSVCWTLIDRSSYEVVDWTYKSIEYPGSKGTKITDILSIAWHITNQLPIADVYVMKAEATSLRASGSDPNNPKVLGVNLQKAQMIAMIVALINARSNGFGHEEGEGDETRKQFQHSVYFLRPTLPFRLYGTLVGNERVSTDQTVEMLLQESSNNAQGTGHNTRGTKDNTQVTRDKTQGTRDNSQGTRDNTQGIRDNTQVYVPDHLKTMFRSHRELQKDMLGHCLLLAITFMDVCVFMNRESIEKLIKRGE